MNKGEYIQQTAKYFADNFPLLETIQSDLNFIKHVIVFNVCQECNFTFTAHGKNCMIAAKRTTQAHCALQSRGVPKYLHSLWIVGSTITDSFVSVNFVYIYRGNKLFYSGWVTGWCKPRLYFRIFSAVLNSEGSLSKCQQEFLN